MKIAVAMSGGVDSTVVASLLMKDHEVVGVTMKMSDSNAVETGLTCATSYSIAEAHRAAEELGIKLYEIDVEDEFKQHVLEYIKKSYKNGITPNPCVYCNLYVKLGAFLEKTFTTIDNLDKLATGHYINLEYNSDIDRYILRRGKFLEKDQSYFLNMLTQRQLKRLLFPLGNYSSKNEVREIARKMGLSVHSKNESQDFLSGNYLDAIDLSDKEGDIVLTTGEVVGKHKGIHRYTIGQRRGLGVAYRFPLYVVEIRKSDNTVVCGSEDELYGKDFIVKDVNWISIDKLEHPVELDVKIRYRFKEKKACIKPLDDNRCGVSFFEKQKSITVGQFAVFYDGDIVVGGGMIEKRE